MVSTPRRDNRSPRLRSAKSLTNGWVSNVADRVLTAVMASLMAASDVLGMSSSGMSCACWA